MGSVSGTQKRLRRSWLNRRFSDRCGSRRPPALRPLPQALAAHHAARQRLADDHRVATGGAQKPAAGGNSGRPELHVIVFVINPPSRLGYFPRLHVDPLDRLQLPAPCRSKEQRCQLWLAAEPRAAANPESLLHRLVLLPVLDRSPDEQAENEEDGRYGDDRENYFLTRVHSVSLCRPSGSSSGLGRRAGRHLLSGPKQHRPDHRRRCGEEGPAEERGVVAAVERGKRPLA